MAPKDKAQKSGADAPLGKAQSRADGDQVPQLPAPAPVSPGRPLEMLNC